MKISSHFIFTFSVSAFGPRGTEGWMMHFTFTLSPFHDDDDDNDDDDEDNLTTTTTAYVYTSTSTTMNPPPRPTFSETSSEGGVAVEDDEVTQKSMDERMSARAVSSSSGRGRRTPVGVPVTMDEEEESSSLIDYFSRARIAVSEYAPEDANEIKRELRALGADAADAYDETCTHVVTPFQRGEDYARAMEDGKIVVSYAWIEDCVAKRRVVDADEKALYAPLVGPDGIRGFDGVTIVVDGYGAQEKMDIIELIEAAGGAHAEEVNAKTTTHLICHRAGSEAYIKAIVSGKVEIVNHLWMEDCIRQWKLLATTSAANGGLYTKMGVEIEYEAALERERRHRVNAQRDLDEEERRMQSLQELLDAEGREREDLQRQLEDSESQRMALRDMLEGEADNREGVHEQYLRQRSDIEELQKLLRQSEASRAEQEGRIVQGEEERRSLLRQLEQTRGLQTNLQTQFTHSRQDLLTQLEQRLQQIEEIRSELAEERRLHAETRSLLEEERKIQFTAHEKIRVAEKESKQARDALNGEIRDKTALQKQLDAERKSRLHILSDFDNERKQREHLIKQLEAEQKLRQSLQQAVSAKEELRVRAEEEIQRLNEDIQEMMDEIDRLKTFEPPEVDETEKIQVKLFLEDDIRFLELEPDVSFEELVIAVGKVFIESYSIKFEDSDKHHITLRSTDDVRIACRQHEKSGATYLKLLLDKAVAEKGGLFSMRRKKKSGMNEGDGDGEKRGGGLMGAIARFRGKKKHHEEEEED